MRGVELLSPHGIALLRLAHDPRTRVVDIAETLGVTERAAHRLIGDLIDAGLVNRAGDGPTSVFEIPEDVRAAVLAIQHLREDSPASSTAVSRRDDIRAQLLAAVERIIATGDTYADVSVERLITEAGVSRSAFYANFQDKADLLQAVVAQVIEEMWTAGATAWVSLPTDAGRSDLRTAMKVVIDVYYTHRVVMIAAADAVSTNRLGRARYEDLMQSTISRIAKYIREGQDGGHVRTDLAPEHAALLLTWGTERGLYKLLGAAATTAEVERAAVSLADVVWNLLYAGHR